MCYACPKFWKFLPECTVHGSEVTVLYEILSSEIEMFAQHLASNPAPPGSLSGSPGKDQYDKEPGGAGFEACATLYKSFQTKRIFLKTYTCARSLSVQLCVRAESTLAPYLLAKEARSPKSGIVKNALFFPNHTPNLT